MHAAGISFTTKQDKGTPLQVTLQLPEEKETLQVEPPSRSWIQHWCAIKGGRFRKTLQSDWSTRTTRWDIIGHPKHGVPRETCIAIAELLVNEIIQQKNVLIKILTVEIYSRHAPIDIHNESQVLESTLPIEGRLFCGTVSAADGKGLKQKLMIATKTMNALCTCSVTLGTTPKVSIGSGYAIKLSPPDCKLFLATAAVDNFKKIATSETACTKAKKSAYSD